MIPNSSTGYVSYMCQCRSIIIYGSMDLSDDAVAQQCLVLCLLCHIMHLHLNLALILV